MNWGRAITIVIILFMGFIVTMGVMMMRSSEGLDEANYYEKGLEHDAKLQSLENSRNLTQPVRFDYLPANAQLRIEFPALAVGADVKLQMFRPDNAKLDKTLQFNVEDSSELIQVLDLSDLHRGKWNIRMNWSVSGTAYFDEYSLFLDK